MWDLNMTSMPPTPGWGAANSTSVGVEDIVLSAFTSKIYITAAITSYNVLGNGLLCLLFIRGHRYFLDDNPTMTFSFMVAVAELLYGCIFGILNTLSCTSALHLVDNNFTLHLQAYTFIFCYWTRIYGIAGMSGTRLIAVVLPLSFRRVVNVYRCRVAALTMSFLVVPLFSLSRVLSSLADSPYWLTHQCVLRWTNTNNKLMPVGIAFYFCMFVLPIAMTIYSNVHIICVAIAIKRRDMISVNVIQAPEDIVTRRMPSRSTWNIVGISSIMLLQMFGVAVMFSRRFVIGDSGEWYEFFSVRAIDLTCTTHSMMSLAFNCRLREELISLFCCKKFTRRFSIGSISISRSI